MTSVAPDPLDLLRLSIRRLCRHVPPADSDSAAPTRSIALIGDDSFDLINLLLLLGLNTSINYRQHNLASGSVNYSTVPLSEQRIFVANFRAEIVKFSSDPSIVPAVIVPAITDVDVSVSFGNIASIAADYGTESWTVQGGGISVESDLSFCISQLNSKVAASGVPSLIRMHVPSLSLKHLSIFKSAKSMPPVDALFVVAKSTASASSAVSSLKALGSKVLGVASTVLKTAAEVDTSSVEALLGVTAVVNDFAAAVASMLNYPTTMSIKNLNDFPATSSLLPFATAVGVSLGCFISSINVPTKQKITGTVWMVGFGCIGKALMSPLFKLIDVLPEQIIIMTSWKNDKDATVAYGCPIHIETMTKDTVKSVLDKYPMKKGDLLLNVSANVDSLSLVEYCQPLGLVYIDSSVEMWEEDLDDCNDGSGKCENMDLTLYGCREISTRMRRENPNGATALVNHGANPGMVSHIAKAALLNVATACLPAGSWKRPYTQVEWAQLAHRLGVKVMHIAERDTQESVLPLGDDEFVNTWSIDAFVTELKQPIEVGWGVHESVVPSCLLQHSSGPKCAVVLERPGMKTKVRSWTPLQTEYEGFLITHAECVSISAWFTLKDGENVIYRPTVLFAYHPSDDAVRSVAKIDGKPKPPIERVMVDDVKSGRDELGVLLLGHPKNAYWFGSRLSAQEAHALSPLNNATSLQVVGGVLGGLVWVLNNPNEGVVEADEIDFEAVLNIAKPLWEPLAGEFSNWKPSMRGDSKDEWDMVNYVDFS